MKTYPKYMKYIIVTFSILIGGCMVRPDWHPSGGNFLTAFDNSLYRVNMPKNSDQPAIAKKIFHADTGEILAHPRFISPHKILFVKYDVPKSIELNFLDGKSNVEGAGAGTLEIIEMNLKTGRVQTIVEYQYDKEIAMMVPFLNSFDIVKRGGKSAIVYTKLQEQMADIMIKDFADIEDEDIEIKDNNKHGNEGHTDHGDVKGRDHDRRDKHISDQTSGDKIGALLATNAYRPVVSQNGENVAFFTITGNVVNGEGNIANPAEIIVADRNGKILFSKKLSGFNQPSGEIIWGKDNMTLFFALKSFGQSLSQIYRYRTKTDKLSHIISSHNKDYITISMSADKQTLYATWKQEVTAGVTRYDLKTEKQDEIVYQDLTPPIPDTLAMDRISIKAKNPLAFATPSPDGKWMVIYDERNILSLSLMSAQDFSIVPISVED